MTYATTRKDLGLLPGEGFVRRALRGALLSGLTLLPMRASAPSLRILYCHYVFDDQIRSFRRLIEFLAGCGRFLNAEEVYEVAIGRKAIDGTSFHLSFDDGFKNIVVNALPVLREYGATATFFVPTAMISTGYDTTEIFCRKTLHLPRAVEIATWDDLAHAREQGFEIASHTRHHIRLSENSLTKAQFEDEIVGSKEEIERHLGGRCRYFSWPYGLRTDTSAQARDVLTGAGFEAAFSAVRGKVMPDPQSRYAIPRHHIDLQWPMSHMRYFAHGGMEAR